jgi:hypothetical protein
LAKSKISENFSLSVEGILDINEMTVDVEEIGTKQLKDLMNSFDGKNVKISVTYGEEITE